MQVAVLFLLPTWYWLITVTENPERHLRICHTEIRRAAFKHLTYRTTKEPGRHFGMGLYYCRNVMRRHGGTIEAQSEPGKGSTFTLHFPGKARIFARLMEKKYDL